MFLALYIQIILLCCGRPSKNVQIIRHRCVLTVSTLPKQKAPPTGGALKCSFVAGRDFALVALIAHRRTSRSARIVAISHSSRFHARRTLRARGALDANQRAYSSSRAAAISSVMFMVL